MAVWCWGGRLGASLVLVGVMLVCRLLSCEAQGNAGGRARLPPDSSSSSPKTNKLDSVSFTGSSKVILIFHKCSLSARPL